MLDVELSNLGSSSSWTRFVTGLTTRRLHGVEFVVSDNHDGVEFVVSDNHAGLKHAVPRAAAGGRAAALFAPTSSGTPWITCRAKPRTVGRS